MWWWCVRVCVVGGVQVCGVKGVWCAVVREVQPPRCFDRRTYQRGRAQVPVIAAQ